MEPKQPLPSQKHSYQNERDLQVASHISQNSFLRNGQ